MRQSKRENGRQDGPQMGSGESHWRAATDSACLARVSTRSVQLQVARVTTANTSAKSSASITTILRYPDSVINLIKEKCVNNSIIAYCLISTKYLCLIGLHSLLGRLVV